MDKRESIDVTFSYQQNSFNELNLLGLKYRYSLKEKQKKWKRICSRREIKCNRVYDKNIFVKVSQGKHPYKDFDHIIVPQYQKRKCLFINIFKMK